MHELQLIRKIYKIYIEKYFVVQRFIIQIVSNNHVQYITYAVFVFKSLDYWSNEYLCNTVLYFLISFQKICKI